MKLISARPRNDRGDARRGTTIRREEALYFATFRA
jgi:hypothetical protein